jgi:hypothetical protein
MKKKHVQVCPMKMDAQELKHVKKTLVLTYMEINVPLFAPKNAIRVHCIVKVTLMKTVV